jgi:hypothetical protein
LPAKVYFKPGASSEEFQRTRARCLVQAQTAEAGSQRAYDFMTFTIVFEGCMRAEGWVLVDKK